MINICKKSAPEKLRLYRTTLKKSNGCITKEDYDKFYNNCRDGYEELQDILLGEQGGICCYCMVEINRQKMRVEHYKPKSKYGSESLNYYNLLASCIGNSDSTRHCDNKKGDIELKKIPNPSDKNANFNQFIDYNLHGEVILKSGFIQNLSQIEFLEYLKEINDILHLNNDVLKAARTKKYAEIIRNYNLAKEKKPITFAQFLNGKKVSFHGFIEVMFQKKISK